VCPARTPRRLASSDREADARDPGEDAVKRIQLSALGATITPLLHRLRRGEGGLIGMATWAAAWEGRDLAAAVWVFALTSALLAAVYLYNDVSDRVVDAYNPAKVPEHRAPLLRRPATFFAVSLATHLGVCLAAWRSLGPWAAACAASLLVLNPLYSAVAKRLPGLDLVVVGAMGAAVVGLATSTRSLLLLAAAMTGISHGFQTRGDTRADRAAGIHSSATAPAPAREAIWLSLCAAFAWTVHERLGPPWAASVIVPYLLLSRAREANRAWGWARVYFAVVWIAATVR
jgi:4-hydroxybenzoate polyprenyltransferase